VSERTERNPEGAAQVNAIRHPHLAERPPPGWRRVDLHAHTMWSGDCTTTPAELVDAVAESGIDVLCITDHGTLNGALALVDQLPCEVVVGQEVRTHRGEIIGLHLHERVPSGLAPAEVCRRIRDQGGVVYVPHPFDPMRANLAEEVLVELTDLGLVDAVEVRNAKTSLEHVNQRAADFAAEHGLAAGAGSDAHVPEALGAAYVEMPAWSTPADFLAALRQGAVKGHHFDQPRPWRARVVPSTRAL
jgi:predicted metal-dependent phosphoesterase TrpH